MTLTYAKPAQVVDNYLEALEKGDFERLRTCLSDSFTYQGPTVQFDNPEDFMSMIWRVGQILNRIEKRKTFVDEQDVCSIMNFHIHIDEPKIVQVMQWARVKLGKITSIEVIFDATEYAARFAAE